MYIAGPCKAHAAHEEMSCVLVRTHFLVKASLRHTPKRIQREKENTDSGHFRGARAARTTTASARDAGGRARTDGARTPTPEEATIPTPEGTCGKRTVHTVAARADRCRGSIDS